MTAPRSVKLICLVAMTWTCCSGQAWIYSCDLQYVYYSTWRCYDDFDSRSFNWTNSDVYLCGNLKNCPLVLGGTGFVTLSPSATIYGNSRMTMYGANHTLQFDGHWMDNSALSLVGTFSSVSRPAGVASMSVDSSLVLYSNVTITNVNIAMPNGSLRLGSGTTILGGSITVVSVGSFVVTDPTGPLLQDTSLFIESNGGLAFIGRGAGSSSLALQGISLSLTVSTLDFPIVSFTSGFNCSLCSLSFAGVLGFTASNNVLLHTSTVAIGGGTARDLTETISHTAFLPSRYFVLRGVVMEGSLVVFTAAPYISLENITISRGTVAVDDGSNIQLPFQRSLRLFGVDVVDGGILSVSSGGSGLQLTICGVSFYSAPGSSPTSVLPSLVITNIGASFVGANDLVDLAAFNGSQMTLNYSVARLDNVTDVNDTVVAAYLPSASVLRSFAAVSVTLPGLSGGTLHMTRMYLSGVRWVFVASRVVLEDSFQMIGAFVSFVVTIGFESSSLVSVRSGSTLAVISDGVNGNGCVTVALRGSFESSTILIANNAFSTIELEAIDLRNTAVSVLVEPTWNTRGSVCSQLPSNNKLIVGDTAAIRGGGLFSYRCNGCSVPRFYPSLALCPDGLQRSLAVDSSSNDIVNAFLNYSSLSSNFTIAGSSGWTSVAMTLYSSATIVSPFATALWPASALAIANPSYDVTLSFTSNPVWGTMLINASVFNFFGTVNSVNLTASLGSGFVLSSALTSGTNVFTVTFLPTAFFTASLTGRVGGNTSIALSNLNAVPRGSLTLDNLVLADHASITAYQITYFSTYLLTFLGQSALNINTTGAISCSYSYCPYTPLPNHSLSVWSVGAADSVARMISYCGRYSALAFGSLDLSFPTCLGRLQLNVYNSLSIRTPQCDVYYAFATPTLTTLNIVGAATCLLEGSFQRNVSIHLESPLSLSAGLYTSYPVGYTFDLPLGSTLKIVGYNSFYSYFNSGTFTGTTVLLNPEISSFYTPYGYSIILTGGSTLSYSGDVVLGQSCYSSVSACNVFTLGTMKSVAITMRDATILWNVFRPATVAAESLRLTAVLPYVTAMTFIPLALSLTVLLVTVPSLSFSVNLSTLTTPFAANSMVAFQSLRALNLIGRISDLPVGASFAIQDCASTFVDVAASITLRAGSRFTVTNSAGIADISTFLGSAIVQPFASLRLWQQTVVGSSVVVTALAANSILNLGCPSSAFTITGGLNQNASLVITSAASVTVGAGVFSPFSSLSITAATVSFANGVIFNGSRVSLTISNAVGFASLFSLARFMQSRVDVTVTGAATLTIAGTQFIESNIVISAPDGMTALLIDSIANRSNVSILQASAVNLSGIVSSNSQLIVSSGTVVLAAAFRCTTNSSVVIAATVSSVSLPNGEIFVDNGGLLQVSAPLASSASTSRFAVESWGRLAMSTSNGGVVVAGLLITVNVSVGGVVIFQTILPAAVLTVLGVTQSSQVSGSVAGSVVFGSATVGARISDASIVTLDVALLCSAASPSRPLTVGAQSALTVRLAGTQPSYSGFTSLIATAVVTGDSSILATILRRNMTRFESLTITGANFQSGLLQLDIEDGIPVTVVSIGSLVKVLASIGRAAVTLDGVIRGSVMCTSCGSALSGASLAAVNATIRLSLPTVSAAHAAYTAFRTRTSGSGSLLQLQSSTPCTGSGSSRTCPTSFAITAATQQGGALVFSFPAMNSTAIRVTFPLLQTTVSIDTPFSSLTLEGDVDSDTNFTFAAMQIDGTNSFSLSLGCAVNGSVPCLCNALLLVNGSTSIAAGATLVVNAFSPSSACPYCTVAVPPLPFQLLSITTKSSLDALQLDCSGFIKGARLLTETPGTVELLSSVENMTEMRIDATRVTLQDSVAVIRNVLLLRIRSNSTEDWTPILSSNSTLRSTAVINSTLELLAITFGMAKSLSFGGDALPQFGSVSPFDAVNLSITFPLNISLYSTDSPLNLHIAGNLLNFHLTLLIAAGGLTTLTMPAVYSLRQSSISAPVEGALRVTNASILGSVSLTTLPRFVVFSTSSQDATFILAPIVYMNSPALFVDCNSDAPATGGSVTVRIGGMLDSTTIVVRILRSCSVEVSVACEAATRLVGSQLTIVAPTGPNTPKVSIVVGGVMNNSWIAYNESAGSCGAHQWSDGAVGIVPTTRLVGTSSIAFSGVQRTFTVSGAAAAVLKLVQLDVEHCSTSSAVSFDNARLTVVIMNSARRQVVVASFANHSKMTLFNVSLMVSLPEASIDPSFVAVTGVSITTPSALTDSNVSVSLSGINVFLQANSYPSSKIASGEFAVLSLQGPGAQSANVTTSVVLHSIRLQTLSPWMDAAIRAVTVSSVPLLQFSMSNSVWDVTNVSSFVGVNISNSTLRKLPLTNESFAVVVTTTTNNTSNLSTANNTANSSTTNTGGASNDTLPGSSATTMFRMVPHAAVEVYQVSIATSTMFYENWIIVLEQTHVSDAAVNDSNVAVTNSNLTATATPPSLAAWQSYSPMRWSAPWMATMDATNIPVSAITAILSLGAPTNISVLFPPTAIVVSSPPTYNTSPDSPPTGVHFVIVFVAASLESVTMRGCVTTAGSYVVQLGPGATLRTLLLDGVIAAITQHDGGVVFLSPEGTSSITQHFIVTLSTLNVPSLFYTTSRATITFPIEFTVSHSTISGVEALVSASNVQAISVPCTIVMMSAVVTCTVANNETTLFVLPALNSNSSTMDVQIDTTLFSGCKYMSRLPPVASSSNARASFTLRCVPWNDQKKIISTAMRSALFIGDVGVNVFGKSSNITCVTASAEPTATVTVSRSETNNVTATPSASSIVSQSTTVSRSATESSSPSATASDTRTQSTSGSVTTTGTLSDNISVTDSGTNTLSNSHSSSLSRSVSRSSSASRSATITLSRSITGSLSPTLSRSLTISIDPCNRTFRNDQSSFIRRIQLLSPTGVGTVNETAAVFFILDRVQFASSQNIQVQVGFNTYLRNFYYNTSFDWFPLPKVTDNCVASGFQLLNATDFVMTLGYDDTVSLRLRKDSPYYCNITFSTDIFQCQLITNQTFNFSFSVLVTGTPENVGVLAKLAVRIGSILANIAQGPAVLQQSRVGVLMTLADCQFSLVDDLEITDSPLQLGFGSDEGFFLRGAVVGNIACMLIVVVAVFLAFVVIAFVTAAKSEEEMATRRLQAVEGRLARCLSALPFRERLRGLMSVAGFPGILIVPLCMTIDSTTSSSVTIIVHPTDPNDKSIGGVGLGFVSLVLVVTAAVAIKLDGLLERRRAFRATRLSMCHPLASRTVQATGVGQQAAILATVRRALRYAFVPIGKMSSVAVQAALQQPTTDQQCALDDIDVTFVDSSGGDNRAHIELTPIPLAPPLILDEDDDPLQPTVHLGMDAGYVDEAIGDDDDDDEEGAEKNLGVLTITGVTKSAYRMMAPILDNRVALFVLAEMCVAVFNAALVGVGISDRDLCYKLATGSVASYVLYFAAYLIVRPTISRLLFVTNAALAFLNVVSSALILASMKTADPIYGVASQKVSFGANILSMLQCIPTLFAAITFVRELRDTVNGKRIEFEISEDHCLAAVKPTVDATNDPKATVAFPLLGDESSLDEPSPEDDDFLGELTFEHLLLKAEDLQKLRTSDTLSHISRHGDDCSEEEDQDVFAVLESQFEVNTSEVANLSGDGTKPIELNAMFQLRENGGATTSVKVRRKSISFSREVARLNGLRWEANSSAADTLNDILGPTE